MRATTIFLTVAIWAMLSAGANATALNVLRTTDGFTFCTDGASYRTTDFIVTEFPHKVLSFPAARSVVAASGPSDLLPVIFNVVRDVRTLDEMRSTIELVIDEMAQRLIGFGERDAEESYSLIVAGFREDGSAHLFDLRARLGDRNPKFGRVPDGVSIFRPFVTTADMKAGQSPGHAVALIRGAADGQWSGDPEKYCALLLEAQRRLPVTLPSGMTAHIVGGFGQVMSVSFESITTKIVVRWPDKIGAKINGGLK